MNTHSSAPTSFNRAEFSLLMNSCNNEMLAIVDDAAEAKPLYSPTPATAQAKRDAMIRAYLEFVRIVKEIKHDSGR